MSTPNKLRILCLHGMVQNGPVFRKKTAVIRKKLDKIAELIYVTAPHLIVDPRYTSDAHREAAADEHAPEESKPFGWWHPTPSGATPEGYYQGFRESVDYLKNILIEQGPFDGVFGFSQGAGLAAVMSELLENRGVMPSLVSKDFGHPAFKFAIICAGFKLISQEATQSLFSVPINTPSMHIYGEQDTLIVPEKAIALSELFVNPVILTHPGGHVVPSNAACRNEITAFVTKFATTS
ncbi:serine hydrolase FSH [Phycomyces blakesleeanus]|uniref:Serine hydrolase FSH n=2 Tax=Phycomyces blakesleeanus TaxID=4837 RepID=A0ABR3AT03_PHYBL